MNAEPDDTNGGGRLPPTSSSKVETLSYTSDIVMELKQLAEKAGYRTLASILAAALTEVRIQIEEAGR
jgi:hypothetical protein